MAASTAPANRIRPVAEGSSAAGAIPIWVALDMEMVPLIGIASRTGRERWPAHTIRLACPTRRTELPEVSGAGLASIVTCD
ncbi:hypothetical protein Isolate57596_13810 [Mycobacteroides abscessus subsp. abscessus]